MSDNENSLGIINLILMIYLIISQFMAIYYWWDWAQNSSLVSTIFIGPIVAELKGFFWIFFIW